MGGTRRTVAWLVVASAASASVAQTTRPAASAEVPSVAVTAAGRPLLEQLHRETQALYAEVQGSVVRVALPPPLWVRELASAEDPLAKWGSELNADVRQKLQEHMESAQSGEYRQVNATVRPTTAPATQPTTAAAAGPAPVVTTQRASVPASAAAAAPSAASAGGTVTFLAPVRVGQQGVQWRPVTFTFASHIGVVMDGEGHVLVPLYVEREVVGQRTLDVTTADGRRGSARFVGSDRMMNLTVLRLEKPLGRPARVSGSRPAEGSVVMLVSPNSPEARLEVWTGGHQVMGLVVGMDGGLSGFARFGHFLGLQDCRPVVEQLIQHGVVRRAQLGVWVQEVRREDPVRQHVPLLDERPALRVLEVTRGSAADRAGLRVNDLVLTLAGKSVGDVTGFAIAISQSTGPTELRVIREGKEMTVSVDLVPQ